MQHRTFMKGLWEGVLARTAHALECGALEPLHTEPEVIVDGGVPFTVHVLARLERKAQQTRTQRRTGSNPFLPPDPDLYVGEVSPTHLCVLNRFNVIDHHLLIVTRSFVDQRELLDELDFRALAACMGEIDGLGFYNAGTVAGASQPHKHLQLVPTPLGSGPGPTPVDLLTTHLRSGVIERLEVLPFGHAASGLDGTGGAELYAVYRRLLDEVGIRGTDQPYNLLVTSRWMLMVPRSREHWNCISVNALGFAGSLLVRNHEQLELVRRCGPLNVLRSVAIS